MMLAASDWRPWHLMKMKGLYDRKAPQAPQADHWPRTAEELPLEQRRELVRHRNKQKRFVAEVSIEDPSSSLAEPRKLSFKACNRFSIIHTTGIYRWRLPTWCPTPPPTTRLLPFSPFCALARSPLNSAALAFVPFGIVLVRVRVRVLP